MLQLQVTADLLAAWLGKKISGKHFTEWKSWI